MNLFIDWLEIEQDFGIEIPEELLLSIYGQYLMVVTEGGEIQKVELRVSTIIKAAIVMRLVLKSRALLFVWQETQVDGVE